jgi:hypothetical protein
MKKILTILLLLLLTSYGFSQPTYVRSYSFSYGIKNNSTGKVDWSESINTNVLIKYLNNTITIYSKDEQVYRTIGDGEKLSESTKFLCVDPDDKRCFTYVGHNLETNTLYLLIEYTDISWIYLNVPED